MVFTCPMIDSKVIFIRLVYKIKVDVKDRGDELSAKLSQVSQGI